MIPAGSSSRAKLGQTQRLVLLERQLRPVQTRGSPEGDPYDPCPSLPTSTGPSRKEAHKLKAKAARSTWQLSTSTTGPTRAFLEGFKKGLDDRNRKPNRSKCEYILSKSLPSSDYFTEALDGSTNGLRCREPPSVPPNFCLRGLQEKAGRRGGTHGPTPRPPPSFSFNVVSGQPPLQREAYAGLRHAVLLRHHPSTHHRRVTAPRSRCPPREDLVSGTHCSTLQRPFWPPGARQPVATASDVAAGVQLQATVHEGAARHLGGPVARAFCPTDGASLQRDGISTRSPRGSVACGRARVPLFDWDADLIRTGLQHCLRIPLLPKTRSAPCAAKSLTASAATQRFALAQETTTADTTWRPTSSNRPKMRASTLSKRKQGSSSSAQTPTDSTSAPALTAPPMCGPPLGTLGARGMVLCGYLLPPSIVQQPWSSGTTTTQNLSEDETLKSTFQDTANRCHQNDIRFTPTVFDGHAEW